MGRVPDMSEATPRPLRIAVIGTGYLGCNTSAGMAEFGFDVIGVEIDEHRLKLLTDGKAPLYEPGLDPLLKKHVDSGRLRFTSDYHEIADWADVHFICAGTPQLEGSEAADLSQLHSVVDMLAPLLTRPTLVVGCNLPTAELVKGGANAFLATKISFINALAEMADATGADVTQLADALGHDKRIGRGALNAGPGYGGGCLPKDLRAFMHPAGELGVEEVITLLREVDDINLRRRAGIVDLTHEVLGGEWIGKNVTVLGAA